MSMSYDEITQAYFVYLHRKHGGHRETVSQESGVPLRTLFNRLRRFGWRRRGGPGQVSDRIDLMARSLLTLDCDLKRQSEAKQKTDELLASVWPGRTRQDGHTPEPPEPRPNPYGYCPVCRAAGVTRTRTGPASVTTCEAGHTYPSRDSVDV